MLLHIVHNLNPTRNTDLPMKPLKPSKVVNATPKEPKTLGPKVKFQPENTARAGAQAIVETHRLGANGESVNEFARLVFTRCSRIRPELFWDAMAALRPFISVETEPKN